ncbi:MAG: alpha/beta fold hydrolase [Flammeovirgaceae bacterium]
MPFIFHKGLGQGHALVLLHGFCENHQIWDGIAPTLANNFQVLMPDLPGFGQSNLRSTPFSIDDVGDQMIQWLVNTVNTPAIVIGHSLGGYVAMAMAVKNPHVIAGLGLVHSTAAADTEEKKQNRNKTVEFIHENGVNPFVEVFVPGLFHQKDHASIPQVKQIAHSTPKQTLIAYTLAMRDRPSREEWLATFNKDFLVLAGDSDTIIPVNSLKNQSKRVPKGTFHSLPVGHMAMYEAPRETALILGSFALKCVNKPSQ